MDERRVMVQGVSTAYYDHGEGPVVLLVHGNGVHFGDWIPIIEELASTHRILAISLPGYGDTGPVRDVRPPFLASFVASFLDELEVERVSVVGHSYGGLIAAEFALRFPGRVIRLVLVGSAGLGRAVNPLLLAIGLAPRQLTDRMIQLLAWPGPAAALTLATGLTVRRPWQVPLQTWMHQVQLIHRQVALKTGTEILRAGSSLTGQRDSILVADRLQDIRVPTLVIWGLTDQVFPLWQARRAVRRLPQGRLEVLVGAGHVSFLDKHQDFVSVLGPFVRDGVERVRGQV